MSFRNLAAATAALSISALFAGCATMELKRSKIYFVDTDKVLPYEKVEPNALEKKGVLLRIKPAESLHYRDKIQVFAQVIGDTAVPVDIEKTRTVIVSKPEDAKEKGYKVVVLTKAKDGADVGKEVFYEDARGKLLKFVSGVFERDAGKLKILSRSRGAIFPEEKVKIGDKWSYEESMSSEMQGTWVSQKSESPTKIKVKCELNGFAVVNGRRCALITATTVSSGKQEYHAFWKQYTVKIDIYAKETVLFDYERGVEVGTITKSDSFSVSEDGGFSDISKTLAISKLVAGLERSEEK